jgi:Ca2+-binding RTX toxin-like protein
MVGRIAITVVAALALAPAAASAATTVDASGGTVFVDGDPGPNAITIAYENDNLVISEEGGVVTDANNHEHCQQDGSRVRCSALPEQEVVVRGRAGDDTLTADTNKVPVVLNGEAGDDVLNAGPTYGTHTRMSGGEGNDTLNAREGLLDGGTTGDAGDDTFNGHPQHGDRFQQEPGADTYAGGTPGSPCTTGPMPRSSLVAALGSPLGCTDTLAHAEGPIAVTLDGVANDGRPGEGDNVRADVETVFGSPAGDVLSAAGVPTWRNLEGLGGDDTITGGAGDDLLDGGGGTDQLSGGDGRDRLFSGYDEIGAPAPDRLDGGEGDDTFEIGPGPDDLVGGGGVDSVEFWRSDVSFDITLDDQPNDGAKGAGDADNVHSDVEIVETGDGADRIVGSDGAQRLYGGSGDDEIDGRGGFDILDGGRGADTLLARDGGFDIVNCGEGSDPAAQADAGDQVENCEATTLPPQPDRAKPELALAGAGSISAAAFRRARGVTVTARTNEPSVLAGEVLAKGMVARAGDLVLGQRTLPLAGAGARKLRIRFSRAYVRAIQRRVRKRAFRLTVRVTATDAAGNRSTASRRIAIRKAPAR